MSCSFLFVVVCKCLITIIESISPYARHTIGDSNRGQIIAIRESPIPYARHTIADSNRGQTRASRVFTICFISVVCNLNGRKAMSFILQKAKTDDI